MKTLTARALVAALALTAFMAFNSSAEARGGNGMGGGYGYGQNMSALTQEQQDKLRALQENHWKRMSPIQDKMRTLNAELNLEYTKAEPDTKKITTISQELGTLQGQMRLAKLELDKEMKASGLPAWGRGMGGGMGGGMGHGGMGGGLGHGGMGQGGMGGGMGRGGMGGGDCPRY